LLGNLGIDQLVAEAEATAAAATPVTAAATTAVVEPILDAAMSTDLN